MDEDKKRYAAIASIVLGFLNIVIGICVPPCGGVLVLVGIALGILGVRSEAKLIGWIGIGVNGVALIAVIAVQTLNIMLATGQIQLRDVVEELRGEPLPDASVPAPGDAGTDTQIQLMPWPEDTGVNAP